MEQHDINYEPMEKKKYCCCTEDRMEVMNMENGIVMCMSCGKEAARFLNMGKLRRSGHSPLTGALNSLMDYPIASMSEGQREAFLKNWEAAKPKIDNSFKGKDFNLYFGTAGIDPCASDGYSKSWEDLSDEWEERMDKLKKEKEKQVGSYETEKWSGTGTIVPIEEAFKK